MQKNLSLGISTCPNDTFIFDAWVNGKLGDDVPGVQCRLEDIATLNDLALGEDLDVVKVSFYAYGLLQDRYRLINAGGAMGRGCGPLVVARSAEINREKLADPAQTVAVPGKLTTANLLVSLYQPGIRNRRIMRFDEIIPAVAEGTVDAGVIIHEGRFTYEEYGLTVVEDLGIWWEVTTGLPIPLGAIIAKKALGDETIARVESAVRSSLEAAFEEPDEPLEFMSRYAQDMDDEVMQQHVALYVNEYSLDYGTDGRSAIARLLAAAEEAGLLREG